MKHSSLPLSALLSQALVAFTIEFDNEAEHRLAHRTTRHGSTGSTHAPWLVSMAMWFNCMQFIGKEGVVVRELLRRARTMTNLKGMARWGYIRVAADPEDPRPRPPRSGWLVHVTPAGRGAQELWRGLFSVIEDRWQQRFGSDVVESLKKSLHVIVGQLELDLPDCLPILGYGLRSQESYKERSLPQPDETLLLPVLLSRVLLAFAIDFENDSDLSLALCANVLRVLDPEGVLVRNLPRLSGVSKEGIAMAVKFLAQRGYAAVKSDMPGGAKRVLLTPKGEAAKRKYLDLLRQVEERWRSRFGPKVIDGLHNSLETLVGGPTPTESPLFRGLLPYPDGWRASLRPPETLPHFPMVLHRGGFPDGS